MKRYKQSISNNKNAGHFLIKKILLLFLLIISTGCEDFLEVDFPNGQLTADEVFEDEATARAAVNTLYAQLRESTLLTGISTGLSVSMGLYADELDYYNVPGGVLDAFYNHTVLPSNSGITSLWNNSYQLIYRTNAIVEGIAQSENLSDTVAKQLTGEALFVRALVHFYLANLFGDIPYITTTDYTVNARVERMSITEVFDKLIEDLKESKIVLLEANQSPLRVIPNKAVASSLLAKIYLQTGQWALAEAESNAVISNTGTFVWVDDLQEVFLKESSATIWQLYPKAEGNNTHEASSFIFSAPPPPLVALSNELIESFESDDQRRALWIATVSDGSNTFYHAHKYKQHTVGPVSTEYSIVFRLAELYLIRAEARVHQGNFTAAREDLNKVRLRAGLAPTTAVTQAQVFEAIVKERRHELFTEHGNRWFDLKRSGTAGQVLAPLKPGWQPHHVLLPIPESELLINPNLLPQNQGY